MSIIRTFCDRCGEIRVGPESVSLETRGFRESAVCVIRCPQCNNRLEKVANEALYAMLTAVGVRLRYIDNFADGDGMDLADSVTGRPNSEEPLSLDEIDRFVARLEADDFLVGLIDER